MLLSALHTPTYHLASQHLSDGVNSKVSQLVSADVLARNLSKRWIIDLLLNLHPVIFCLLLFQLQCQTLIDD